VPAWNEGVRLGGVSLSQSFIAGNEDVARWNYSLAFGAVDQSAAGQSGDLAFGPKAGSASLTYHHGSGLSLSSHTQVADDLMLAGVTSQYDLGILGRWRSGVARSNQGLNQGWRYRAMADFAVADDMSLAWMGERHTAGHTPLCRCCGTGGRRQAALVGFVGCGSLGRVVRQLRKRARRPGRVAAALRRDPGVLVQPPPAHRYSRRARGHRRRL
jgi:hypothetical protein